MFYLYSNEDFSRFAIVDDSTYDGHNSIGYATNSRLDLLFFKTLFSIIDVRAISDRIFNGFIQDNIWGESCLLLCKHESYESLCEISQELYAEYFI